MARIVLANDHGAVEIAALIKDHLQKRGFDVTYLGVGSPESVDYPDKAEEAVNEFRKGGYEFGVLCCGTGIGISLAANKMNGIRCALPQNSYAAKMSREHNNVNFIAFGGRIEYQDKIEDMLDAYIDSTFQGGRHERRVEKIMSLEGR
ncbi:MAG: RpiB/LacA/LacB family sugar-phosphate isomerase [Sphaerochaetaceae bacterium]|jgi:ribose 5-phosphate isomerase B|nr:RpiB/LacA/LacB family sugar-phosphate isomerase [Sphaerochaetaceae bacterium]NLY07363.1 RpiB/LacA/LacB family sugar-phosphate isomerase [Spirochaetales bacterium]